MKYYFETPDSRLVDFSMVREATSLEVAREKAFYRVGKCQHGLIEDHREWLWNLRICSLCGKGKGLL